MRAVAPILTPHGQLLLAEADDAPALPAGLSQRLQEAFERGSGHGLLQLGAGEVGTAMPPVFGYWRDLGARYVTAVCTLPDVDAGRALAPIPPLPTQALDSLTSSAPPMTGAEYVTWSVLEALWEAIDAAFRLELSESKKSVQDFLKRKSPAWNLVGRVHFNLAENRKDDGAPFAFLATYTTRLSAHAKAQHLPLGQALSEYAGAANRPRLLSLLLPVQRAAEQCAWLKAMVDAGEIYHPLRWTPAEAFQLLTDVPRLEAAGVIVRVPGTWRANRPPRPQVSATVGGKAPSGLGTEALLDFRMEVTLDGERLTAAEISQLLAGSDGLHLVRGRWVEVDREKLARMLDEFRSVEKAAAANGLTFAEAMRMLAGANVLDKGVVDPPLPTGRASSPAPGWRDARGAAASGALARVEPGDALKATLRPYQQVGVRWLHLLVVARPRRLPGRRHGPGQDDPGAGAAAGAQAPSRTGGGRACSSRPASLLANWASEIERFAPSLKALVAHPSAMPAAELRTLGQERLADVDLVITSYGSLLRVPGLLKVAWHFAVLDEAQAIKNPGAKQTRAAKQLDATRASRSPARRSRTGSAICGRSSISSTRACSARARSSRASSSGSRRSRTIRTGRCASWCGPTSCGG